MPLGVFSVDVSRMKYGMLRPAQFSRGEKPGLLSADAALLVPSEFESLVALPLAGDSHAAMPSTAQLTPRTPRSLEISFKSTGASPATIVPPVFQHCLQQRVPDGSDSEEGESLVRARTSLPVSTPRFPTESKMPSRHEQEGGSAEVPAATLDVRIEKDRHLFTLPAGHVNRVTRPQPGEGTATILQIDSRDALQAERKRKKLTDAFVAHGIVVPCSARSSNKPEPPQTARLPSTQMRDVAADCMEYKAPLVVVDFGTTSRQREGALRGRFAGHTSPAAIPAETSVLPQRGPRKPRRRREEVGGHATPAKRAAPERSLLQQLKPSVTSIVLHALEPTAKHSEELLVSGHNSGGDSVRGPDDKELRHQRRQSGAFLNKLGMPLKRPDRHSSRAEATHLHPVAAAIVGKLEAWLEGQEPRTSCLARATPAGVRCEKHMKSQPSPPRSPCRTYCEATMAEAGASPLNRGGFLHQERLHAMAMNEMKAATRCTMSGVVPGTQGAGHSSVVSPGTCETLLVIDRPVQVVADSIIRPAGAPYVPPPRPTPPRGFIPKLWDLAPVQLVIDECLALRRKHSSRGARRRSFGCNATGSVVSCTGLESEQTKPA